MKVEPLYLTDAQIAEKIPVPTEKWRSIAAELERQGLPRRDPLFGDRRYWPAVRSFLDRRHGLRSDLPAHGASAVDGEERWNEPAKRRA